jgi:riboflavin kinase/FMN adenylyltransferase
MRRLHYTEVPNLMELIRNIYNLHPEHRGCVATIGNFDGVHLGHQAIIQQLLAQAKQRGLPSMVICFEPQPAEYFDPNNAPPRLTRLREKVIQLAEYGVTRILCLSFNKAFADLSPQDFIQNLLIQRLGVRALVIGQDFRFGHRRMGNLSLLEECFDITLAEDVMYDDERVSSTRTRTALAEGNLTLARELLGRPYSIQGLVIQGDQRGRLIGFPTANIPLNRNRPSMTGVFAVRVHGIRTQSLAGVANIGSRPTVDGTKTLLEVHLFDFDESLYNHHIQVDFIHKLRDEKRFDSFELLKAQISLDAEQAKTLLSSLD